MDLHVPSSLFCFTCARRGKSSRNVRYVTKCSCPTIFESRESTQTAKQNIQLTGQVNKQLDKQQTTSRLRLPSFTFLTVPSLIAHTDTPAGCPTSPCTRPPGSWPSRARFSGARSGSPNESSSSAAERTPPEACRSPWHRKPLFCPI